MGLGSFIWNSVEFTCYLCIIAYVFMCFGIITPKKAKKNQQGMEGALTQAINIAGKLAGVETQPKKKKQ